MNQIGKIGNLHNKTLVSFDIKSLFIKIPVDFTIELTLNQPFICETSKINRLNKKQSKKQQKWTCKKIPYNLTEIIIID